MNRFMKVTGALAVTVATGMLLNGCGSWNVKNSPEEQRGSAIREGSGSSTSVSEQNNWSSGLRPVRPAEPKVMQETNGWLRGYGNPENKINEPAGAEHQTSHMRQLPKSEQPAPPSGTKSSPEYQKSTEQPQTNP